MRGKVSTTITYELGNTRTIKRFLFFPKKLRTYKQPEPNNYTTYQWRWLETALIVQILDGGWGEPTFWYDDRWGE